jgi:DnaK suppressor protein
MFGDAFDAARRSALALQSMVDVERFRVLLEEERLRKLALLPALRRDIMSVNAARQDSNVDDEHDPEGATIAFELSQASALLLQSTEGLGQIDAALARIAAGRYGICEVCGEEIAEGRLEARPWTPYCIRHSSGRA